MVNFDISTFLCLVGAVNKYVLLGVLWLCAATASAQQWQTHNKGVTIGVVAALGNRYQRIGVVAQAYYTHQQVQLNAAVRLYRSYRNTGPAIRYNEIVTTGGVVVGYGQRRLTENPFVGVVANQTQYTNSVGYAYNLYLNRIKTSQQTGIVAVQVGDVSIVMENDIFARPTLDRFRTGAFLVSYRHRNLYEWAINCTLWTGQMGNKVTTNTSYPYVGYMDTTGGVYTQYSHGLLSGQMKVALPYGQNLQANIGVDAEQVRNVVQNRGIHDMAFLPRKWRSRKNCHLPMLDTAGNQYLYLPGQKIKAARPYWNVFGNGSVFY
jgi:hypothetical protein